MMKRMYIVVAVISLGSVANVHAMLAMQKFVAARLAGLNARLFLASRIEAGHHNHLGLVGNVKNGSTSLRTARRAVLSAFEPRPTQRARTNSEARRIAEFREPLSPISRSRSSSNASRSRSSSNAQSPRPVVYAQVQAAPAANPGLDFYSSPVGTTWKLAQPAL